MEKDGLYRMFVLFVLFSVESCSTIDREARTPQVCYDGLDCFSNLPPFNNTENLLPQSPEIINTIFRLFTRTCKDPKIVRDDSEGNTSLNSCGFDSRQPLKFLVHGFLQKGTVAWIKDMAKQFLLKEPMSIISVDWGNGARFPYSQAAANTRVVGAQISRMINFLIANVGITLDKIHIIGHSLGAHAAGYSGTRVPGLGRITGLDPAQPDYESTNSQVHLDPTDATFVDIIHSDDSAFDYVSGFGWMKAIGHIDFYPNGGEKQPGCPKESVGNFLYSTYFKGLEGAEDEVSCGHSRSIFLFIESINSKCSFFGHPCSSIMAFDTNLDNCLRCERGACPEMGYNANRSNARGKFYLRTRKNEPYCGYAQHIKVEFGQMNPTNGQLLVEIVGQEQSLDTAVIESGSIPFLSGNQRDVVLVGKERVDSVRQVRVTFKRPVGFTWWWSSASTQPFVTVKKVTVTSAEDGRRIHFCGEDNAIANGKTLTLTRSTTDPNECLQIPN